MNTEDVFLQTSAAKKLTTKNKPEPSKKKKTLKEPAAPKKYKNAKAAAGGKTSKTKTITPKKPTTTKKTKKTPSVVKKTSQEKKMVPAKTSTVPKRKRKKIEENDEVKENSKQDIEDDKKEENQKNKNREGEPMETSPSCILTAVPVREVEGEEIPKTEEEMKEVPAENVAETSKANENSDAPVAETLDEEGAAPVACKERTVPAAKKAKKEPATKPVSKKKAATSEPTKQDDKEAGDVGIINPGNEMSDNMGAKEEKENIATQEDIVVENSTVPSKLISHGHCHCDGSVDMAIAVEGIA